MLEILLEGVVIVGNSMEYSKNAIGNLMGQVKRRSSSSGVFRLTAN